VLVIEILAGVLSDLDCVELTEVLGSAFDWLGVGTVAEDLEEVEPCQLTCCPHSTGEADE
jgi:hypothetical protein